MSLTFTDWFNCTDSVTGQTFLLNWTADTGMLAETHVEALRLATLEKFSVVQKTPRTYGSIFPLAPILPGDPNLLSKFNGIVTGIEEVCPFYLNQIVTGGSIEGLTNQYPWTFADLKTYVYSAFGESWKSAGDRTLKLCSTLRFYKRVLDLLAVSYINSPGVVNCERRVALGLNYAGCDVAWPSSVWEPDSIWGMPCVRSYYDSDGYYRNHFVKVRVKCDFEFPGVSAYYPNLKPFPSSLNSSVDLYVLGSALTWYSLPFFNANGDDVNLDTYHKIQSVASRSGVSWTSMKVFDNNTLPVTPTPNPLTGYSIWGAWTGEKHVVGLFNWAVPGGFIFQ